MISKGLIIVSGLWTGGHLGLLASRGVGIIQVCGVVSGIFVGGFVILGWFGCFGYVVW